LLDDFWPDLCAFAKLKQVILKALVKWFVVLGKSVVIWILMIDVGAFGFFCQAQSNWRSTTEK